MRVQEFASRAGVARHVARYYIRIGLLRPRRAANRYARFVESDLRRLAFVRRARRLGFTLSDVRRFLSLYDAGRAPCPDVRVIGRCREAETAVALRELTALHGRIGRALRRWRRTRDKPADIVWIPIARAAT